MQVVDTLHAELHLGIVDIFEGHGREDYNGELIRVKAGSHTRLHKEYTVVCGLGVGDYLILVFGLAIEYIHLAILTDCFTVLLELFGV